MTFMSRTLGATVLTVTIGMGLSTLAFSGTDRTIYDKPTLQTGKIIQGKVMDVDTKSPLSWNVSVADRETGEIVVLHIDKDTTRKNFRLKPDLGDFVIAQYNQHNNHAYSFLTNEREHN